ncbi:hypothetical protein LLG88_13455 [bacterium]|nr:hypothetical protein [bacterium]
MTITTFTVEVQHASDVEPRPSRLMELVAERLWQEPRVDGVEYRLVKTREVRGAKPLSPTRKGGIHA